MSTSLRVQVESDATGHSEPLRPYLGIHALNVFVKDQEKSLRFYCDQLGFELAFDAQLQTGERWLAVAPPDGSAVIALIAPQPESPQFKLIGQPTGIVFVTEDVPAKYIEWSKRGVRFRHTPRLRRVKYERHATADRAADHKPIWGGVFTRFEDIDRNSFALVSFDEVTREVERRRQAVLEKLESERRVVQEMEIAKHVQARLFPQSLPPLQTLDYAGVCIQARQVGGDYYDFLHLGQERLGLVVGDVSGKGIAAALLMANLQANLRSQCAMAVEHLERLLQSVNQLFYENSTENAYATLFFAEYDDRAQRVRYANCGHLCGLVLRSDDSIDRLESTAMVLGLFKEWDCQISECELFAGDTLALYTDGMTEAFDHKGEEFGEERLAHALCQYKGLPATALLDALLGEVRQFSPQEQHDDITLLIAKCCGNKELQRRLVY
jgi:serine phosphatase RsbU (regulator of sigma subunit)